MKQIFLGIRNSSFNNFSESCLVLVFFSNEKLRINYYKWEHTVTLPTSSAFFLMSKHWKMKWKTFWFSKQNKNIILKIKNKYLVVEEKQRKKNLILCENVIILYWNGAGGFEGIGNGKWTNLADWTLCCCCFEPTKKCVLIKIETPTRLYSPRL